MIIKMKIRPYAYHYWESNQATCIQQIILHNSQYSSNIIKCKSHASDETKGFIFYYQMDNKQNRKDWISTIIDDIYTSLYKNPLFLKVFLTPNFLIDIS